MVYVVAIEDAGEAEVCDFAVEHDHSFQSAGIVAHNCPICMGLDGQSFSNPPAKRPPIHLNCRCALAPRLRDWQEMGLPLGGDQDAIPARAESSITLQKVRAVSGKRVETQAEARRAIQNLPADKRRQLRQAFQGEAPPGLTYGDWLRRMVKKGRMDVVEEALGKKKAKLFAAGQLDVSDFAQDGQTLTLRELRAKEPEAFEAAGVN
jgi:hypothetical protein